MTNGPRAAGAAGLRLSRSGGMERAGATSTGREGATCRRGIGDGIDSVRVRADFGMAPE